MEYIFDTSSLIVLLDKCQLGNKLVRFSKDNALLIPFKVREEYLRGCQNQENISLLQKIFTPIEIQLDDELLPYFNFESSSGEFWVISHAKEKPDLICVIDEQFGRNICDFFKLKYTGTIGVIALLIKAKLLSDVELKEIKRRIKESDFFLSDDILESL